LLVPAHPGDFRAQRLRDLHGERAHAPRRADDQDLLTGLDAPVVADGLQGGAPEDGDGRRLVEGEIRRLRGELVGSGSRVLGEGAGRRPEHLVARREAGHVGTDRLDRSGQVPARVGVLRPAETEARQPDGEGQAGHDVPGPPVHARRVHPHQDLALPDGRPVDLCDPEEALGRGAVAVLRDHMMVAHSFRGEVFGSARRLHGAMYAVDATFRREGLCADSIVDIGRAAAALHAVIDEINYRNLDDEAAFAGLTTPPDQSTEVGAVPVTDQPPQSPLGDTGSTNLPRSGGSAPSRADRTRPRRTGPCGPARGCTCRDCV
jgi:hypothetical protein